jgi:hypothetical protein
MKGDNAMESTPAPEAVTDRNAEGMSNAGGAVTPITVDPATNVLTLDPGDTEDETIVVTILGRHKFNNVSLVPSGSIGPFVTSVAPPGGYGPLTGERDRILTFRVQFHGLPCKEEPEVVTGTMDVVADGNVVARKDVQITVPPCPSAFVYSVKFICGEQPERGCECAPVQPGRYASEINIHNYGLKEIEIHKRFVPVVLAGAPAGREPRSAGARAEDRIVLPARTATMDDCCRIEELLFGGALPASMPLTIGLLEISTTGPVAVTAVYTTSGLESGSVSIEVEQIAGRQLPDALVGKENCDLAHRRNCPDPFGRTAHNRAGQSEGNINALRTLAPPPLRRRSQAVTPPARTPPAGAAGTV